MEVYVELRPRLQYQKALSLRFGRSTGILIRCTNRLMQSIVWEAAGLLSDPKVPFRCAILWIASACTPKLVKFRKVDSNWQEYSRSPNSNLLLVADVHASQLTMLILHISTDKNWSHRLQDNQTFMTDFMTPISTWSSTKKMLVKGS